jgi:hypothetical protein
MRKNLVARLDLHTGEGSSFKDTQWAQGRLMGHDQDQQVQARPSQIDYEPYSSPGPTIFRNSP